MATGLQEFPSTGPGNDQGDMSPAFTREQQGQPDINAPTNPYANRGDVRRMILERMGGRDPFSHDYRGQVRQRMDADMQQLFNYAFRGTSVRWDDLAAGRLHPEHQKYWATVLKEHQQDLETQALDQQRRDAQLYTKMSSEFEADRRQHNADYWKSHPTEAMIRQTQLGVIKEAERITEGQLKQLPKDTLGNYAKPGKDKEGKDIMIPLSPGELASMRNRAMEQNVERIATYTGTMKYMPRELQDSVRNRMTARQTTIDIAKEWSEGKASIATIYERINSIPDPQQRAMVAEQIATSGEPGRKLMMGMQAHQQFVGSGKESPVAYINQDTIDKRLPLALDPKAGSWFPGAAKIVHSATTGVLDALGVSKGSGPVEGGGGGGYFEPPQRPAQAEDDPMLRGTMEAAGTKEKPGFWETIRRSITPDKIAGEDAYGAVFGSVAERGSGPQVTALLDAGRQLAQAMTPQAWETSGPPRFERDPMLPADAPAGPAFERDAGDISNMMVGII
jgi:hypothetical protein